MPAPHPASYSQGVESMSKSSSPATKEAQIERFRETARANGVDEDGAAFKAKLGVMARQKPLRLSQSRRRAR